MNNIIDNAHDDRCKSANKVIGALGNSLEDGLHVIGRPGDDLQDFRSRGLPLQRLPGLVEQPRVLDRDDRLVGEGLDELDSPSLKASTRRRARTKFPIGSPSRINGTPSAVLAWLCPDAVAE